MILAVLLESGLAGCGPSAAKLEAVDNAPLPGNGWTVSIPRSRGWTRCGQLIVLVDALDVVVVVTADPPYGQTGQEPWNRERANINLVADFIASLPGE